MRKFDNWMSLHNIWCFSQKLVQLSNKKPVDFFPLFVENLISSAVEGCG